MKLEDLKREDWIVGGVALVLIIGLLAFPWWEVGIPSVNVNGVAVGGGSISESATGEPEGWAGILALIVVILLIVDLALERFAPQTTIPELGGSREATRFFLAVGAMVLIALKFVLQIHFSLFGWGFYLDVILGAALIFFTIQARRLAAPAASTGPATP